MNMLFSALLFISVAIMLFKAPAQAFPAMIDGVSGAVSLSLKLLAIYAVWLSVLKMAEATGLNAKLSKLLRPVIRRLFKGESEEAYEHISVNLASNMLGMGGVATPAGIKAMNAMQKGERATNNMLLLFIINATSIQLVPATVIAIRASAGSADASSIFLPTLIATAASTASGIILAKVFSLTDKKKNGENGISNVHFDKIKPSFCRNARRRKA